MENNTGLCPEATFSLRTYPKPGGIRKSKRLKTPKIVG
jgi:hypothetical protein